MSGLLITCTVIVCWTALAALVIACLHHGSQQQRHDRQARHARPRAAHRPYWARTDHEDIT